MPDGNDYWADDSSAWQLPDLQDSSSYYSDPYASEDYSWIMDPQFSQLFGGTSSSDTQQAILDAVRNSGGFGSALSNNQSGGAAASGLPDSPNRDMLSTIMNGLKGLASSNPGAMLSMGAGSALAMMGFATSPGGKVKTPDGRTVQLSPQEQQLMNTMLNQAQQTASISTPVNEQLALSAQRNAPGISNLMDIGLNTLPTQAGTQQNISNAVNQTLGGGRAQSLFGQDVTAAGQAGSNILDILQRGGGNDAVTSGWRQNVLDRLQGGADPTLLREQEQERAATQAMGLRTQGPGFESNTGSLGGQQWYSNLYNDLLRKQGESRDLSRTSRAGEATQSYLNSLLGNENAMDSEFNRAAGTPASGAKTVASLQSLGNQGAATNAGLFSLLAGKDPTATAAQGFSGLSSLGNAQSSNDLTAQMFNTQQTNANRNMLLGSGGALFGIGATRRF